MRPIVLPAMFLLFSSAVCADENDDIVNGCNFSNAEFGSVAIESAKDIVARCVRGRELGWSVVKLCIDRDIDAEAVLANYGREHDSAMKACKAEFGHRGAARIKACVDQATEAAGVSRN